MISRARLSLLSPILLAASLAACSQDHSLLAPTGGGSGTSGSGASTGQGGDTSSTTGQGGAGGTTTTSTTDTGGAEPTGPTKLTVLNGVNDYPAIRVCFQPYPSGPSVDPWPASSGGLPFHESLVVDPPDSLAPFGDVQPFVLAGDLTAIAGKSCDEALALANSGGGMGGAGGMGGGGGTGGAGGSTGAPPPIVAAAMPVIPESVFSSERSLLLVFFGCLGGPGHDDGTAVLGCGFTYTPATPTASLTLVSMSRKTEPKAIAMQFVHASAALQPSDIRLTPGFDGAVDIPAVSNISLGGLAPKPPFFGMGRADFGVLSKAAIKTFAPNDTYPTSAQFLQDAFVNGDIKDPEFADGSGFTFIAIGGYPGVVTQSFWHPFTFTMVKSDP